MEIFKKLTIVLTTLILLNFLILKLVKADDSCPICSTESNCNERITCLDKQKQSLSSQIKLVDTQIIVTQSKIDLTQQQLGRLTDDISSVSGKIGFIEDSLVTTSNILANRIAKTYMAGRADPVVYLLTAADFSDFWSRLAYLRVVQKHDQQLLLQMAATRKNYHDQKDLLTDKKKQVETLSAQLRNYKVQLNRQNKEKQALLVATQEQLDQAITQLAAFQSFVQSQGGAGLLSNQTKCDDWGCYYNQRDSQWGTMALNHTGYTLADSGCLVTSMAMVITHHGHKDVTPQSINSNSSNFAVYFPAFLNLSINAGGPWTRERISYSQIDGNLPVVVGIGYGPAHFVVLVSGSNGNYLMNDPFVENGSKIPFTSKYSLASITEIDAVKAN